MLFVGTPGALQLDFDVDTPVELTVSVQIDDGPKVDKQGSKGSVSFTTDVLSQDLHQITWVLAGPAAMALTSDLTVTISQSPNGDALTADDANDPKGNPCKLTKVNLSTSVGEIYWAQLQ